MLDRSRRRLAAALAAGALLSACAPGSTPESSATPVIVDYSPTVSDVGALIYLLSDPEVDVLAVTLPGTGEAGCAIGLDVTLGILAMFNRGDVPTSCDPTIPAGAKQWPPEFIGGNDALTLALPDPLSEADSRTPSQLIADIVADSDEPVVLYAVAPLTNVANAMDLHPEIEDDLAGIVIMGGAVDVAGNVADTGAEWNLWIDVPAAARVISSDAAITLVPLDATNHVPTPGLWDRDIAELPESPQTAYLAAMLSVFPAATSGSFYLWDELAASAVGGHGFLSSEPIDLVVVEDQDGEYGATRRSEDGKRVTVAVAVPDPDAFYRHFLSTVSGAPAEPRAVLTVTEADDLAIGPDSASEEILAFWLLAALAGDASRAADVVAADAEWPGLAAGLGGSPDVFVAGSAPYGAFDVHLTCSSAREFALCDGTWNDKWLAANPHIDMGRIRVKAQVSDGKVAAFEEVSFNTELGVAFDAHISWLATNYPERLNAACSTDAAAAECTELLVDTAVEWIGTADADSAG